MLEKIDFASLVLPDSIAVPRLSRSLRKGLSELLLPFEEACFSKAARAFWASDVFPEVSAELSVSIRLFKLELLDDEDDPLFESCGGGGGGPWCCIFC